MFIIAPRVLTPILVLTVMLAEVSTFITTENLLLLELSTHSWRPNYILEVVARSMYVLQKYYTKR